MPTEGHGLHGFPHPHETHCQLLLQAVKWRDGHSSAHFWGQMVGRWEAVKGCGDWGKWGLLNAHSSRVSSGTMKIRVLKWVTVMMEQVCDCTQPSTSDTLNGELSYVSYIAKSHYLKSKTVLRVTARNQLQHRLLCEKAGYSALWAVPSLFPLTLSAVNDMCCCSQRPHRGALRASGQTRRAAARCRALSPEGPAPTRACRGSGWEPRHSLSTHGEALCSLIWGVWFSLVNSNLVMFWRPGFRHKNSHVSRLFAPVPQSYRRGCLMDRTHTHVNGLYMKYRQSYTHTSLAYIWAAEKTTHPPHTHTLLASKWNTEETSCRGCLRGWQRMTRRQLTFHFKLLCTSQFCTVCLYYLLKTHF